MFYSSNYVRDRYFSVDLSSDPTTARIVGIYGQAERVSAWKIARNLIR